MASLFKVSFDEVIGWYNPKFLQNVDSFLLVHLVFVHGAGVSLRSLHRPGRRGRRVLNVYVRPRVPLHGVWRGMTLLVAGESTPGGAPRPPGYFRMYKHQVYKY